MNVNPLPTKADVGLALAADHTTVPAGDVVTLTATVTNDGPADATSLRLNGILPAGATLVSATVPEAARPARSRARWATCRVATRSS